MKKTPTIDAAKAEQLIKLVAAEGTHVGYNDAPKLEVDASGNPSGVYVAPEQKAMLGTVTLDAQQWEAIARHLIEKHEMKGTK